MSAKAAGPSRLYGWIAVSFAVVAIAFLATTIATVRLRVDIDRAAVDLRTNSLESVRNLSESRTALRRFEAATEVYLDLPRDASPEQAALAELRATRAELQSELDKESNTPWYAGERETFERELVPALARIDAAVARAAQDRQAVVPSDVDADFDAVDVTLGRLLQLNEEHAFAASQRILTTHRRAERALWSLAIACTLLAAAGAGLAIRSARRYSQAMQENAELLAARGSELQAFAERAAHDLVAPLGAATLTLGAVKKRTEDEETRERVGRVERSLLRAGAMVQGVLNFARAGGQPRPGARADVARCIAHVVEEVSAAEVEPPELEVIAPAGCEVACDEVALSVILANLVGNAAKHVRGERQRRITVRAIPDGATVRLEVEDTGPGLAPGLERTVFDRYVTASRDGRAGLGLGLATVKRFATAYGGKVGVRRGAVGALFWVELAQAPADPLATRPDVFANCKASAG